MLNAETVFEELAERTGWNADSMLAIACEYIDNQKDPMRFYEFAREKALNETEHHPDCPWMDGPACRCDELDPIEIKEKVLHEDGSLIACKDCKWMVVDDFLNQAERVVDLWMHCDHPSCFMDLFDAYEGAMIQCRIKDYTYKDKNTGDCPDFEPKEEE